MNDNPKRVRTAAVFGLVTCLGLFLIVPQAAQAQINVLTVDCTPLVPPPPGSFGQTNTMGMALQIVDQGSDFNVTEVTPLAFRNLTAAQLSAFDLIAVNNAPARLGDNCVIGAGNGLGTTWHSVVGINSGGRVVLTSHDAPRFKLVRTPPAPPLFTGFEPFGTIDFVRQAALWAGGLPGQTGLLIFNDAARFGSVGGVGWDNPELNLPLAWGINDSDQTGGSFTNGGYTDILPAFAGHPIYVGLTDGRGTQNTLSSFSANIGDTSFHSVFATYNASIFTPTEQVINAGIINVGGLCFCAGNAAAGPDGLAITLIRDVVAADVQLTTINKGQPARAVECAAPGPNNEVHPGNGRGLAHDPHHNHLFYTEFPWDVIYKVDPSNAQPAGGIPQVCELIDSCPVVFPDGTPMPIGAMGYMDRNDFNPPAPFDILWLAPYDGSGFGGIGDIWQLAIDTDDPADQFYPQRNPAGICEPTLVAFAPLGRGPQCPDLGDGFPDGLDFDPSPDLPGLNSIWISDDASDLVQRLIFPEDPLASYKVPIPTTLEEHFIHKCNTAIAVDPTAGAVNPIWLNEYAIDFRSFNIEEVYLSQRPRNSLNPWVFEAAAYDMGLFGADPNDLGVQNARTWEDGEFDETEAFPQFGHRCGVWAVDNATTILRSGTNLGSNELTLIRFDVPCGADATEVLEISERLPISLTTKLENNGPAGPIDVALWETVDVPEGCDVSYLCQDNEVVEFDVGVPFFELLPDGTLLPLGIGPAVVTCVPGLTFVGGGTPAPAEVKVHTPLIPNGVPVGVPVNFHQEFDKHCSEAGTKIFDFCVQVLPMFGGVEDPDPANNSGCVQETVEVPEPCDPDPATQGYWHRQCLGLPAPRGIDPGRNGRGPTSPTEPNFDPVLMDCAELRLEDLGFFGMTTCEGMDADPPSDPCERAKKQTTALILNVCSGRLANSCEVDVLAQGCSSTTVGDLLDELAGLIMGNNCQQASDCAAAVNEGTAVIPPANASPVTGDLNKAKSHTDLTGQTLDPTVETTASSDTAAPFRASITSSSKPTEPVATESPDESAEPSVPVSILTLEPEREAVTEEVPEEASREATPKAYTVEEHLALFGDASASREVRREAEDALLTALGGGYEPAQRLEIARALIGKVDVALHSLLAEHLEDIRAEALELGDEALVKEAERLLKKVEPTEE